MPDLQSELSKVLTQAHFDDEPSAPAAAQMAQAQSQSQALSKREAIWNYVRDNPSSTSVEVSNALNLDATATATTLLQMVVRKVLDRTQHNGLYHYSVAVDAYPRFDKVAHMYSLINRAAEARKSSPPQKPKKAKVKAKPAQPAKSLDEMKQAIAPQLKKFNADEILAGLNVLQAKELLRKLNELFGM